MNKFIFTLLFLSFVIFVSCGEKEDTKNPENLNSGEITDDFANEMIKSSLAYIKSTGFEIKKIDEVKLVNFKNGDRFVYVGVSDSKSNSNSIYVQFAGTYNKQPKDLQNVVLISCNNDGACQNCKLSVQGSCGVLSCGCSESGAGSYDCYMNYNEFIGFKSQFLEEGNKLIKNLTLPRIEELKCESY